MEFKEKTLNDILIEEIAKVENLGFDLAPIKRNIVYVRNKSFYGSMSCKGQMKLNMNFVLKAPEDEIRATIAHEVCHRIKGTKQHDRQWGRAVILVLEAYKNSYIGGEYHLNPHPFSKNRAYLPHTNIL